MNKTLIFELITHQIDLMRYEKIVRADVFALLDNMQNDVSSKMVSGSLNTQIEHVEHIVKHGYESILNILDVLPVLDSEMLWLAATLSALTTAYRLKDKIIPFAQQKLKELAAKFTLGGLTLPETIAKQRHDLSNKIKAWLRQAKIDDTTPNLSELGDFFDRAKNNAKTMTRTWINSVSHTAHEAFAKLNPFVKGFRHLSILDGKTSTVCTHRNGLLWDKKHEPIGHNESFKRPPLHPNCRSQLVYVYDLNEPFDGFSGSDWVQSRTLEQLQEQFGQGIGQMLFDGSVQLSDALEGMHKMSLKELRQQYTLSIFSDNFTERFNQLHRDVIRAKNNGIKLSHARQTLALDKVWEISYIDEQAQKWLGAKTDKVWLSEDTLIKQFFNHDELGVDVYHTIAAGLNHAEKIIQLDDKKIALFKFYDEIFEIIIKTTNKRDELYVVSIFKADKKEISRIMRKGIILKE